MQPNYHDLEIISEKLRRAIVATLDLNLTDRVFVGNQEKSFLYSLFLHMPNSEHKRTVKIKDHKDITLHNMIDIWNAEIEKKQKNKKNQSFRERFRYFLIEIRALLINIRHIFFLKHRLQHASTIVHYTAHLRYASFTIPGLTSFFFKYEEKKDKSLRKKFHTNLSKVGLEPILVEYLTSLFPTSHLESYSKFSAHEISNIKKIDTVVTSLAGICGDPLLSFLVKNNSCKLVYVQHGGGYGFYKNHVPFQIENDGADIMYYWGTGDNNIYPTRYRDKYFSKISHQALIVLNDKKDDITIKPYVRLANIVTNKLDVFCVIAAHPNGPAFEHKNIQQGVGYTQHEKAQLIVYENLEQSLIYARILSKRPFLIIDEDSDKLTPKVELLSDNAFKFILLLKEAGILVSFEEIEYKIEYWMKFSPKEAKHEFEKKARLIFNHVLNQPKIQDTFLHIK